MNPDDQQQPTPNRFQTDESFIDYGGAWFITTGTTPEVEFDLKGLGEDGVVEKKD